MATAFGTGVTFEIRTTGNDGNGGLFDPTASGVDYSQQDSPQYVINDISTGGVTTNLVSAGSQFSADMVGNGINLAGVLFQIATFSSTAVVTVTGNGIPVAGSAQTGTIGGALKTPGYAGGVVSASNIAYIKAGTYTLTSTTANVSNGKLLSVAGTEAAPTKWIGYQTTRGDNGTKPVIAGGATTGIALFSTAGTVVIFDNIEFSIPDSASTGLALVSGQCRGIRCKASGTGVGFQVSSAASDSNLILCEGLTTTSTPFLLQARCTVWGCVAHGSSIGGFTASNNVTFLNCIAYDNSGVGFTAGNQTISTFYYCTAYNNGGNGFELTTTSSSQSNFAATCLAVSNGAYGFAAASTSGKTALYNCSGFNNTSGNVQNTLTNVQGFVTLSGDPFVNAAGLNFGLNNTAGAGGAARAAGIPGPFPGIPLTVGFPDIGAVQHQDAGPSPGGGGSGMAVTVVNRIPG